MKVQTKDLLKLWQAPDHSRLTAKQISLRLPVAIAARVAALCEMYPNKNRTQVISDLLSTALSDLEDAFPVTRGKLLHELPDGEMLFADEGIRARYYQLVHEYTCTLERDAGREELTGRVKPGVFDDGSRTVFTEERIPRVEMSAEQLRERKKRLEALEREGNDQGNKGGK